MTGLYVLLWAVIALRELGELSKVDNRRAAAVWLAAALTGLALWMVYQSSTWRLAEWLLHWR